MIFDSLFDAYRGVIVFFRVVDGSVQKVSYWTLFNTIDECLIVSIFLEKGDKVRFMASGAEYEVTEVGVMTPVQVPVTALRAGEVGYICASIKDVKDAKVGDTIALARDMKSENPPKALPGYSDAKPMVFCGLFPTGM